MDITRRSYLTGAGGALLAAGALMDSTPADAADKKGDVLYGHGLVWNQELSGIAGQVKLSFDLRVNLPTGIGFGTADDPVHPDWDIHFAIESVKRTKEPKGEVRFDLSGSVTHATNLANVGLPVRILAQTEGDGTAVAIRLGDLTFAGAGLVVIPIIGVLIALLGPSLNAR